MNPAPDAPTAAHSLLRRSTDDRILLGVCAGLARTLELRTLYVRAAAVLLGALAFPLLAIGYAAVALIVPRDDGRTLLGGEPHDGRERLLGWSGVLVAAVLLLGARFDPQQLVWPSLSRGGLVLAAVGIGLLIVREGRAAAAPAAPGASAPGAPPAVLTVPAVLTPPAVPAPPASPAAPADDPTVRIAAPDAETTAVPPVRARRRPRRRTALVASGVLLLVLAAFAAAGFSAAGASGGVGERTNGPASVTELPSEYRLGVGSLDLDLRDVKLGSGAVIPDGA